MAAAQPPLGGLLDASPAGGELPDYSDTLLARAILQEAALSFLGLGTGSAHPTWGQMIALGRDTVTVA